MAQNIHRVAIVGLGVAGLCMAMRLKRASLDDFVILEKAGSLGGTWRDNVYPGAACDIESHLYSFSFGPKPRWTRKFATQAEIRAYLERCAAEFALAPKIRFGTDVAEAIFDPDAGLWRLKAVDGFLVAARVLVMACGQLSRPAMPALPGLADFEGAAFHSARWPAGFSHAGKRVAVIGTGASAIQIVPAMVADAAALTLFQRSGAWVAPKGDRPFTPRETAAFAKIPGWRRFYRAMLYWKNESRAIAFGRFHWMLAAPEWLARRRLKRSALDARKQALLAPAYRFGCKRVLLSDDWLPAVASPKVDIVDAPIARVDARGLWTEDGRHHPADAIVLATGFETTHFLAPIRIMGLDGRDLQKTWAEGASAFNGMAIPGFPNLFVLYGPNTNLAHNSIVFMIEAQTRYVLRAIRLVVSNNLRVLEVEGAAHAAFARDVEKRLGRTIWSTGCRSWYKTPAGRVVNNWPGFSFAYWWRTLRLDPRDYKKTAGWVRTALVTGAGAGIGRALARELASRGFAVFVTDVDEAAAVLVAREIGGTARAEKLDVRDAKTFQTIVARIEAEYGQLDMLVNNAGMPISGEVQDLAVDHWDRILDVNLRGTIHGVHAAYPGMRRRGFGMIVNVGSIAGLAPGPLGVPYATTKHAVVGLSTSLRAEAALYGVKVSVLCPGGVDTEILDRANPADLPAVAWLPDNRDYLGRLVGPAMASETLARRALDAVEKGKGVIVEPLFARAAWRLHRYCPWVVSWRIAAVLAAVRRKRPGL